MAERSRPLPMGGALGTSAPLWEAGVAWPRAAPANTAKAKAAPMRIIQLPTLIRERAVTRYKNEPRPTLRLFRLLGLRFGRRSGLGRGKREGEQRITRRSIRTTSRQI